jgi:hypothetical protein
MKGILNPYLYYALNNESCMAKFQAIICHRSFVEIKMLGLRYVAGAIPGKSQELTMRAMIKYFDLTII